MPTGVSICTKPQLHETFDVFGSVKLQKKYILALEIKMN